MKVYNIRLQYPEETNKMEIVLTIDKSTSNLKEIQAARVLLSKEKDIEATLKEKKKKRSQDANSYCWVLSQKIAEAIGNTKEFVYKEAIRRVGQFEILPIKEEGLERWIAAWESKGMGWQSEVLRDSKLDGYVTTINYFGSSVYSSKEMALLIDELVTEAKMLDIETITPREQAELISTWKGV